MQVLAHILTNGYLHGEIREKGGAYGGGASFGANGVMSLYSYRDPNLVPTLQHFNDSIQWILDNKFSEEVRPRHHDTDGDMTSLRTL